MDAMKNGEVLSSFNGDIFNNFLDEEIPQDIFDDIMNDVNFNAMGLDMNSLSSEDSGRSSSSYDDHMVTTTENFFDQPMPDSNSSCEIKDEPSYSSSPTYPNENVLMSTVQQPILIQQPFQTIQQPQQQHLILQQPNIVVKHEQLKVQPGQQQILTLQSIGGNLFTAVTQPTTTTAPVHTLVNGTPGILTKIPIVPVTRIHTSTAPPPKSSAKDKKKSGHNIIERRYRTSIVIIIALLFYLTLLSIQL